ncbi:hypothetical protein UY3_00386 [Chelonia mydas]|uniref:Uncharacterized protein n=1 Tax=Chelonia mydas TaxID=8469 RepID=M7CMD5_CHEMY|nr:hypothetical protein UY3_00386 [Chelonia mydas]
MSFRELQLTSSDAFSGKYRPDFATLTHVEYGLTDMSSPFEVNGTTCVSTLMLNLRKCGRISPWNEVHSCAGGQHGVLITTYMPCQSSEWQQERERERNTQTPDDSSDQNLQTKFDQLSLWVNNIDCEKYRERSFADRVDAAMYSMWVIHKQYSQETERGGLQFASDLDAAIMAQWFAKVCTEDHVAVLNKSNIGLSFRNAIDVT